MNLNKKESKKQMKEISKNKYLIIRKILKGHIIVLWILTLLFPIVNVSIQVICDSCMIPDGDGGYITSFSVYNYISYWVWGHDYSSSMIPTEYFVLHPIFYFSLILFWIGFILNFGNIKQNYKNKIINRNLGYISALFVLIALIGMYSSASFSTDIGFSDPSVNLNYWERTHSIGFGFTLSVVIINLIFGETIFLNRVKISKEEKIIQVKTAIDNDLKFCHSCGAKIKKSSSYCEFCGIAQ